MNDQDEYYFQFDCDTQFQEEYYFWIDWNINLGMQPPKEEDNHQGQPEQIEEEEEEMTGKNKTALNERLILCSKRNQYEQVEKCIKKKADLNYEENNKKKWTAFIWACCSGFTKIVRFMISKGAANQYLEVKQEYRTVVMGSTKQLRPNPLHWASFKGHIDIVQLLLKTGLHWQDVDSCGNNSVMLAASANFADIFKKYLQLGVLLSCKNSRGHTAKDLSTNPQILSLINIHDKTLGCPITHAVFKEKDVKHWCWVCGRFVGHKSFKSEWILKQLNSAEKQELDGRCSDCWSFAAKMRSDLEECMASKEEVKLKKMMNNYVEKFVQLDITFLDECKKLLHRLEIQNQILGYVQGLGHVDNYKVILKSVNHIQQMLKDSQHLPIDQEVIDAAKKTIDRLNAQRNLRYEIDNIDTSSATREGVSKLQEVYSDAQTKSVSTEYLQVAGEIKGKMSRSIRVQDLLKMFEEYPLRPDPYPAPLAIDFKTKKPLDPQTKKPTDPANLLPKKKKGKKQPKFLIPQWATELKELNERIKEEEQLLARREQLGLNAQFCKKVEESVALMKKESRYRKDMDTLQAMVDEANKKKK